jgi:hypothetical protein
LYLARFFVRSIHFRVTFNLTSQILRRFLSKSCVSVYYYVRPSALVFAGVLRHSFQTMDGRSSHSDTCTFLRYLVLDPTPKGFSSSSYDRSTLNLYHVLRYGSLIFFLPTLFTFPHFSFSDHFHNVENVDDGGFGADESAFSGCLPPQGKSQPSRSGWLLLLVPDCCLLALFCGFLFCLFMFVIVLLRCF